MYRAYKYRLYPTPEQAERLDTWFAAARAVYNAGLEQRLTYGRSQGKDVHGRNSYFHSFRQKKELGFRSRADHLGLKDDPDLEWITDAPRDVVVDAALRNLDRTYDAYFAALKRGERPPRLRYRSYDRNNSLTFQVFKSKRMNVIFGRDCVTLPKIGRLRYVRHQKFYGAPKTAEVIREGDEFYIILVVEQPDRDVVHVGGTVGLRLGVDVPLATSDGYYLPVDAQLERLEDRIGNVQRQLSRAQKGSRRRDKVKKHLAALRRKQARRRSARLHKVTTELTRKFAVIGLEDVRLKDATQSGKGRVGKPGKDVQQKATRNRQIQSLAHYKLKEQLLYKAARTGSEIALVECSAPTAQAAIVDHETATATSEPRDKLAPISKFEAFPQFTAETLVSAVSLAENVRDRADLLNTSAGAPARRQSSDILEKMSAINATVSCLQPATVHKIRDNHRVTRDQLSHP